MSRETLLDNAIAKAKEAEDWQLVEWLRMARGGESAARWYSKKLREASRAERKLLDENAKLREEVHYLKKGDILHVLTDQEYIDQCERERLMQVSIDALDDENAKLRELVRDMAYCMQYERECDECRMNGADGNIAEPCGCDGLLDRLRELGVVE